MTSVRPALGDLKRHIIGDLHHVVMAAGFATVCGLVATALGRDPDLSELGWIFFCVMGILFHRASLIEQYRDRAAIERHPSSTEADLRSVGDHIRGEWIRIATKSFFLFSGGVALYMLPRADPTLDTLRLASVTAQMFGVFLLDIDAILDRVSRRKLVALIKIEIQSRPLGLPTDVRLERAITAAREMFHLVNNELSIALGTIEAVSLSGITVDTVDLAESIKRLDEIGSEVRSLHATIRSLSPSAGGPSKTEG